MIYEERPAPAGLEAFVSKTWFLRYPRIRRYEKILPLPFAHLILDLSDPYRLYEAETGWVVVDGAFVSGVQRGFLVIENPDLVVNAGVEFTPAGLGAFSRTPSSAVVGRVQDAENVLPGATDLCRAARATAADPAAVLDAIEAFLLARRRAEVSPDPVVERALALLRSEEDLGLAEVARRCGVSHKTLISHFHAACGLPPKAWSDVWRFHRLVSSLPIGAAMPTWADIAAGSHFFDQAHFVRTFRRFSGLTPSAYLRQVQQFGPEAATFIPLDEVPAEPVRR